MEFSCKQVTIGEILQSENFIAFRSINEITFGMIKNS